jgi:hypothetical protein
MHVCRYDTQHNDTHHNDTQQKGLFVTVSRNDNQHNNAILFIVMLGVIMQSVIMPSVIMPSVIMLNVITGSVVTAHIFVSMCLWYTCKYVFIHLYE